MPNHHIFPALFFVVLLHMFAFSSAYLFFSRSTVQDSSPEGQEIAVDFAVVPEGGAVEEEPAAEVFDPPAAEVPEPVPDPEPQPVLEAPKPKPESKAPKPKPRPAAQGPRAAIPNAAGNASPSVNAAPSPVTQKGAGGNAVVLRQVKPSYPALSRRKGEEGRVVLNVLVRADGTAGNISIKRSSGFSRLDTAAESAVRRWRFEPYRVGGLATDHEYSIVIIFSLLDQ